MGTRCRELVRLQLATLELYAMLSLTNALHAERALLHDAFAAHGDVRIQLPVERLGERVLPTIRFTDWLTARMRAREQARSIL